MSYVLERDGEQRTFENEDKLNEITTLLDEKGVEYTVNEPDTKSQTVEVVDKHTPSQKPIPQDTLQDPLETLPEWMKSEIQHGRETTTSLNKRGSQVIANALELVVKAKCEIAAKDTDFEYSRYRAIVTTPDGQTYNAVGDAHIDEDGKDQWDLERLAETRAKKRAVKWATGGGIQGFVESRNYD